MNSSIEEAKNTLASYTPDSGNITKAESALVTLEAEAPPEYVINELLRLFERFPEEYADVVFWSAMHQLEALPTYEFYLLNSVKNIPSCFGLLMVNRLLNAGQLYIGQTSLMSLLEQVSTDNQYCEEIKEEALDFIQHQKNKLSKGI